MNENNNAIFAQMFSELDVLEDKIKQISHGYSNIIYEYQQTKMHIENKLEEECAREDMRIYILALSCLKQHMSKIAASLEASEDLINHLDEIEWSEPLRDVEGNELSYRNLTK